MKQNMAQKDFFPLRPEANPMIYAYEEWFCCMKRDVKTAIIS